MLNRSHVFIRYLILWLLGAMNDFGFLMTLNALITIAKGGAVVGKLQSLNFAFDPITFGTILGVSSLIKVVHIAYDKHIRTQKGGQNHGVAGMWLPLIFRVVWVVYSSMYEPNMDKKNDLQSKDEIQLVLGAVLAWTILLFLLILIPTHASLISIPILFVVFFVILGSWWQTIKQSSNTWYAASPAEPGDAFTLLHAAVYYEHADAVQRLCMLSDIDIDINKATERTGYTPLALAAYQGNLSIATILLETNRADVNKLTNSGLSPLMLASINGYRELVNLLIYNGANTDTKWNKLKAEDFDITKAEDFDITKGVDITDTSDQNPSSTITPHSRHHRNSSVWSEWSDDSEYSELGEPGADDPNRRTTIESFYDSDDLPRSSLESTTTDRAMVAGGENSGAHTKILTALDLDQMLLNEDDRKTDILSSSTSSLLLPSSSTSSSSTSSLLPSSKRTGGSAAFIILGSLVVTMCTVTTLFREGGFKWVGRHQAERMRSIESNPENELRGNLVEVENSIADQVDLNAYYISFGENGIQKSLGGTPRTDVNNYDLYTENLSVEKYISPSIHIQDATVAGIPGCTITIQLITPTRFAIYAQDPTGNLLYASVPNDSWGTRHFQLILYICSLSIDEDEDDTTALNKYIDSLQISDTSSYGSSSWPANAESLPPKMYISTRTGKTNTYDEGILRITRRGLLWIGKEGRVAPITGRKIPRQKIFVPFIQSKNGYTLESSSEATVIGTKSVTLHWLSFSTKTVKGRKIRVAFENQSERKAFENIIRKCADAWQLDEGEVAGNNVLYATQMYKENISTQQVNNTEIQHLSDNIESIRITPRTRPREARWLLCFQVLPYPFNIDRPMECAILIDSRHVSVSRNLIDWLKAAEQDSNPKISNIYGSSDKGRKYGVDFIPDSEIQRCMNCNSEFTLMKRRHHCRVCGGIFCGQCVKKRVMKIDFDKASDYKKPKYVCDICWNKLSNDGHNIDDVTLDDDSVIDITERVKKYTRNASGNTGQWTLPIGHCIHADNYKKFEHILQGITYELNTATEAEAETEAETEEDKKHDQDAKIDNGDEEDEEKNLKKCNVAKYILGELTDTLVRLAYPNGGDAAIRTIQRVYSRMKHYGRYDEGQKTLYQDTLSANAARMMFQVYHKTVTKIHCFPDTDLTLQDSLDAVSETSSNKLLYDLDQLRESLPDIPTVQTIRSLSVRVNKLQRQLVSKQNYYKLSLKNVINKRLNHKAFTILKAELNAAQKELDAAQAEDLTVSITYTDSQTSPPIHLNIPDVRKADVTPHDTNITFNPLRPLATETVKVFPFVVLSILSDETKGPPEWLLETIKNIIFTGGRSQTDLAKKIYEKNSTKDKKTNSSTMTGLWNMFMSKLGLSPSKPKQGGTRTRALTLHTRPRTYQKRAPPVHNNTPQHVKTQRHRRVPCASLSCHPHTKRRYKSHPRKRTRTSTVLHHATTIKATTGCRRRAGGTRRGGAQQHAGRRSRGR